MFAEQRQAQILQLLDARGSITLTELVTLLQASESTIRRDLQELDKKNKLVRVFGGAMSVDSRTSLHEERVADREAVNIEEKNGKWCLISNEEYFCEKDSRLHASIELQEYQLYFIKSKIAVAHGLELARRGFRVNLIGGEIRTPTEAIVGSAACEELRSYNFTKCFMGTNGANPDSGFTTPDIGEAVIKGRAMAQSRQRYILCTAEKYQIVSPVRFADFADATVITDHCPDSWYEQQTNVIVAP